MTLRKLIHVSCAIIEKDGLVLAARRSPRMSHPNKWEFPGGKLNPGESPEAALIREIAEELAITITPHRQLETSTHHYENVSVTLYPFVCVLDFGEIQLHEHSEIIWLPAAKLHALDWAEADIPVLEAYLNQR